MLRFDCMRFIALLLPVFLVFSCTTSEEGDPEPEFTLENELELSGLILEEILDNPSDYGEIITEDQVFIYSYINRVRDSLLQSGNVSNRSDYNWKVYVVKDTFEGKIYAVPGGKVFLTSGILLTMQGEDELAALLAREISYLDNGLALNKILDVYGIPLTIESFSDTNRTNIPDMTDILINSSYNRENEELGDLNSVKYLCGMNYASFALAKLYLTIENDSLSYLSRNFFIYPNSEDRRNKIVSESEDLTCSGSENYFSEYAVFKDSLRIQ